MRSVPVLTCKQHNAALTPDENLKHHEILQLVYVSHPAHRLCSSFSWEKRSDLQTTFRLNAWINSERAETRRSVRFWHQSPISPEKQLVWAGVKLNHDGGDLQSESRRAAMTAGWRDGWREREMDGVNTHDHWSTYRHKLQELLVIYVH